MKRKNCPVCDKDIGVLAIVKAALPSRIKCPHCKTRAVYKPFPWVLSVLSLVLYLALLIITIAVYSHYFSFNENTHLAIYILLAILVWQPFELVIANRLRNKHNLWVR
ncbi:hypothetical protein ACJJI3_19405 [Microbulbifer sp. ZKSA004]|uniref:hypothetical protein n=1 Tax=Microbulbifer sp. ZKSA004 TaxID=3243389 RepID=UPI00403A551B